MDMLRHVKLKINTKTTVTSIYSLLAYENKYYLQVYLVNCAYKIENKQMTDLSWWKPFKRLDIINFVLR